MPHIGTVFVNFYANNLSLDVSLTHERMIASINEPIHTRARFVGLFVCLCLTSHRQRGHLETATPFTVPCEGREARQIHRSDRELNPGPSHGSPLRYRCATQAPLVRALYKAVILLGHLEKLRCDHESVS